MPDKTPTQAMPDEGSTASDAGTAETAGKRGGGDSGGGPYPNPHTGKEEAGKGDGFVGGQSGGKGGGGTGESDLSKI